MKVRPLTAATAALLAVALTGCVDPSTGVPPSADLADFGVEPSVTVVVDDDGFTPDTVTLAANSTIAVTNDGADRHGLVQIDTPSDRRIETGDLVRGETVDIHIADPGSVELTDPHTGAFLTLEIGPAQPAN